MSWSSEKLGALIRESRIPANNPNPNRRIRVKLNVLGVEKRPFENEVAGATKQFQRKAGQFIYGKQNFHKGAFGIIPSELDGFETSADIPSFDVREDCLPEWIFYYFKVGNRYLELVKYARGVGSQRIHPEQIADIEIPLPSLNEQRVLIERIKKIEESSHNFSNEIKNQETILAQLRQSILREAMQGKLVKQDPNDGHAKDLLNLIKSEKSTFSRKGKVLAQIEAESIPFIIPNNWEWCRLGEILTDIKYGTSQKCDYDSTKNSAVLRIPNVSSGDINCEDLKFTNLSEKEKKELSLEEGDILIIRSNGSKELVGKTVIVTHDFVGYTYAGYLVRFRFNKALINPYYLWLVSKSPFFRYLIETPLRTTVGINNINTEEMSNLLIPLPPHPTQCRIVKRIFELMNYCNELEKSLQTSSERNDLLLQQLIKDVLS